MPQTFTPEIAARVPVPPVTTARMYSLSRSAFCAGITRRYTFSANAARTVPFWATASLSIRGSIITPPLATPAAIMHMCIGVATSALWPAPVQAISRSVRLAVGYDEFSTTRSRNRKLSLNPKVSAVLRSFASPSFSASWAKVLLQLT